MENASRDAAMMQALVIRSLLQYTKFNNHSQTLPCNRASRLFHATALAGSSAQPRRETLPCTTPRDMEVPRTASPDFQETPYHMPGLPCPTPLPREGGYPLNASLHWSDDRPEPSNLGWSSLWDPNAELSGLLDRPVFL